MTPDDDLRFGDLDEGTDDSPSGPTPSTPPQDGFDRLIDRIIQLLILVVVVYAGYQMIRILLQTM